MKPVFGRQDKAIIKHLRKLSEQCRSLGTNLSLTNMAASLRSARFNFLPEQGDNKLKDPLRFKIYRLVNRENIWFGNPDRTPVRKYGVSRKPSEKVENS